MLPRSRTLVGILALGTLAAGPVVAQSVPVSGLLAQPGGQDVVDYAGSADGAWAVMRGDLATDEVFELFVAPSDGGTQAVRRSAPLVPGGDVVSFQLAGAYALYRADQSVDETFELYSVPLDGSAAPVRLNGPLAANADVGKFWPAPGNLALFAASDPASGRERLYRVPADGSLAPVEIADSGSGGAFATQVVDLAFSADGTLAVYRTFVQDPGGQPSRLFRVPVDGSLPALELGTGSNVLDFLVSADGSRVGFLEGIDTGVYDAQVYATRTDGSQRIQLSTWTSGLYLPIHAIASDGSWFLFQDTFDHLVCATTNGGPRFEVATTFPHVDVALDGQHILYDGAPGLRSVAPLSSAYVHLADEGFAAEITPDSAFAVYRETTQGFTGLFRKPISGGAANLINRPPVADVSVLGQAIGGDRLVYIESRQGSSSELDSARLDGVGFPVRLSQQLSAPHNVISLGVVPGGQRALYLADARLDEVRELFTVPVDGSSPPVRLHAKLSGGPVVGDVDTFATAGAGNRALYRADSFVDDRFQVYLASLDETEKPAWLTSAQSGSNFSSATMGTLGEHAVFATLQQIYAARTHGEPHVTLVAQTPGMELVEPLTLTPDETRVVYRFRQCPSCTWFLASAPVDGSSAAVQLHASPPAIPANSRVTDIRITPDGATVVFLADHAQLGVFELFRVPADGSAAPVRLHAPLPATGDVTDFALSPDGSRVLYLADALVDQRFELYSVPTDASLPPVKLNGTLPAGGNVSQFLASPNGLDVVYRADETADGTVELFRVPIAGGAAPVLLTPNPSARPLRTDFALSADGTQVVYRFSPVTTAQDELRRVATDGLSAPVVVNGPLAGTVRSFALSPAQDEVVYLADERIAGVIELYRASLAGGPSVAIDPLPATADVDSYRISPDGELVVYRADRDTDDVFELYGAPLDGSGPVRRMSGAMTPGGDVQLDFVALQGGRALYRADQESDEVFELFQGFYSRARPARRLR